MTCEQQLDRALAYFTDEDHKASYEILSGTGTVMFSAPHAVLQTRNGTNKAAERYTGILCKLLNEDYKHPVIYKTRYLHDDANHDIVSDYRDALCRYVKRNDIRYVIDLHQLNPKREIDVCIGTGFGRNLSGHQELVDMIRSALAPLGIKHITIDNPFPAEDPNSVCATVANCCDIPAIQLEINSRLLTQGSDGYCLADVLKSLHDFAVTLNAQN
ncbi:MAG: hypothetical protein ABIG45_06325 [Bacillota bacterium]